jgi:hypothetical protein
VGFVLVNWAARYGKLAVPKQRDPEDRGVAPLGSTGAPAVGLGRIVALYCRSSTLYQNHSHIRCLYF